MKRLILTTIIFISTSSCATTDINRTLANAENELQTNTDLLIQFHSVLYYPSEISLNFPGFIVGIEKSDVDAITSSDKEIKTISVPETHEDAKGYRDRLIDKKVMYISHVVKNYGLTDGQDNCAIYNAYYRKADNSPKNIDFCKGSEAKEIVPQKAYSESWSAINELHNAINDELDSGSYSHIVLVAMGWNTAQEEAVRNFNSIIKNLRKATTKDRFNPLFVGVTWPSMWESSWLDPIYKGGSYPVKSTDADEVGFSWLGAILHYSLADLNKKLPLIVIGHSFGARTTSMASCVGPAISQEFEIREKNKIDLLISLQGAYSINRFFKDEGIEGIKYPNYCSNVNKVILTSSRYDQAIDIGKWVPSVGNDKTFNSLCDKSDQEYKELDTNINCAEITPSLEIAFNKNNKKILYLNADQLVKYNAYKSGGGAHSDIYRKEMGQVLWKIIELYGNKI